MIKLNAYAKLNLSLDITGKRTDGYHLLDTIMQSINLCDTITITKADDIRVSMDKKGVDEKNNTAYKAAVSFAAQTGIPGAHIHIIKRIPAMAGLGGASADAAAVLIGLNALYSTGLSADMLAGIGVKIGADVPFSLIGGLTRAQGIGEELRVLYPAALMHYTLIKPHTGVSTAQAFARYQKSNPVRMASVEYAVLKGDIDLFVRNARNVLDLAALSISPEMLRAGEALMAAGAPCALMSGSGSTLFAPFASIEEAVQTMQRVKGSFELCGAYSPCDRGVKIIGCGEEA